MKTLMINMLLVLLVLVSVSALSQIQTENGWNPNVDYASWIDSILTGSYRTTDGGQFFGMWGETIFIAGGQEVQVSYEKGFSNLLLSDTVSVDCKFLKGTNNRIATCVYLAVEDTTVGTYYMFDDNRVQNLGEWTKFSWNMLGAKNFGIKRIDRIHLIFTIYALGSSYVGTDLEFKNLNVIDNTLGTSTIDFDTTGGTGVSEFQVQIPSGFALSQNYPNPFNPSTTINYTIAHSGKVKLAVYSLLGTEVAVLVNETQSVGPHTARFNAQNLASGAYIYKLQTGNFVEVKKMLLVK
jgi:hypothetical protein